MPNINQKQTVNLDQQKPLRVERIFSVQQNISYRNKENLFSIEENQNLLTSRKRTVKKKFLSQDFQHYLDNLDT